MCNNTHAGRAFVLAACLTVAAAFDGGVRPLAAQAGVVQDTVSQPRGGWTTLRVAKWTTAAAATSLAVYGVMNNRQADHRFEELEQVCVAEPARCDQREPDGSYSDTELENNYQHIRRLDRRARSALLAGQVGIAASVLLFVLDLRNDDGPENIPYEPRRFDAGPSRDGGLTLQVNLGMPGGR